MSGILQTNARVRREILESTALIRKASGFFTPQSVLAALSFCAEYVAPPSRWTTSVHVRHAPLLEPGVPAEPRKRPIG